jgi:hypothetical protein
VTTECEAASSRQLRELQNGDDQGTGEEFWRDDWTDGAGTGQKVALLPDCFMMMMMMMMMIYSVSRYVRNVRGYETYILSPGVVHLPCHVREINRELI